MERAGFTHLAVYGDREHFANLLWLSGLDPRFEEALLILGPQPEPLLLTGIECESYLPVSPLFSSGALRQERFAPFSLPNIVHADQGRPLADILRAEGIHSAARLGCVGTKGLDLPAYLMDALRAATPECHDATQLFIHPATGLRTFATAKDIAWFEYSNVLASDGLRRMLEGIREGATDYELIQLAGFNGFPQGCHWGLKTGPHRISLASPNGTRVALGQPLSGNVCYRGSNCCRAGWGRPWTPGSARRRARLRRRFPPAPTSPPWLPGLKLSPLASPAERWMLPFARASPRTSTASASALATSSITRNGSIRPSGPIRLCRFTPA